MNVYIATLYQLLNVPANCSDQQLRTAYLEAMKRHHPDVNPDRVHTATLATQRITEAYSALKQHRQELAARGSASGGIMSNVAAEYRDKQFGFASGQSARDSRFDEALDKALLTEITERKSELRQAYATLHANPTSVVAALCVISAAIACEREDVIEDLLKNSLLIDSAVILYSVLDSQSAPTILHVWERYLWCHDMKTECLAVLEDALATGEASDKLLNALRSHYYFMAKGDDKYGRPTPNHLKPSPEFRIMYLMKIVELGDARGYVYKQLAGAYYDSGDLETARAMLRKAIDIDPDLTGAVKISRSLGMSAPVAGADSSVSNRPYRDKQAYLERKRSQRLNGPFPSLEQIQQWVLAGSWGHVLAVAHRTDYGHNERETMRVIAQSLGSRPESDANNALIALAGSFYWDVHIAACASLARSGSSSTLEALCEIQANKSSPDRYLASCIEYLSCRLSVDKAPHLSDDAADLIEQGYRAFSAGSLGRARCILEHALGLGPMAHQQSAALLIDDERVHGARYLLARACAGMGDLECAIYLLLPLRDHLPASNVIESQSALASWLWSYLFSATYDPSNDHFYTLALDIHVDTALAARTTSEFLYAIKYLTRWLELVGDEELVVWVHTQVGDAAPGYGELRRGMSYLRAAKPSEALHLTLNAVEHRIKVHLPKKLRDLFNATSTLDNRQLLLDS